MNIETEYANTDFDLESETAFDVLHRELKQSCLVLHYTGDEDGRWRSTVEADHDECSSTRNAAKDIPLIIEAIKALSPAARAEFNNCSLREFNIGISCADTFGYVHTLPPEIVSAVAELGCSIAVTLYPVRNPDGTLR